MLWAMYMKYPKLKDKDNLSRKLTDEDIKNIRKFFEREIKRGYVATSIRNRLAQEYKVSYATIFYWTNDKHREQKREKDNKYWGKMKEVNPEKWYLHKKQEIARRRNRMIRNPELKLWNEVVSAKNDKRINRKTVKGKPLAEYDKDV